MLPKSLCSAVPQIYGQHMTYGFGHPYIIHILHIAKLRFFIFSPFQASPYSYFVYRLSMIICYILVLYLSNSPSLYPPIINRYQLQKKISRIPAYSHMFRKLPIFSIVHTTSSPGLRKHGGFIPMPVPAGVPVDITHPGLRVIP